MKFSYKPYALRCVLGAELVYAGCIAYGAFVKPELLPLHQNLLQLLPAYDGTFSGMIASGLFIAVHALIFAAFMVWMNNSSLTNSDK